MNELQNFYRRERKHDERRRKWRKFWLEFRVFLAACALIAAVAWAVGLKWIP